jgi:hypothetical protein
MTSIIPRLRIGGLGVGPDRGPDIVETARRQVMTLPYILVRKIVAAMHTAAFLTCQRAPIHPPGGRQHGRAFARPQHIGSAGRIRLRNTKPRRIEARQCAIQA